ncbi:MAG TPA: DUF6492 family protein [Kiritimatiellia bacterium]|nr:DUF6492 family protein [Kiritimatiellia bacterium]HMP34045.1 DUF6492 family protein [Kiritimatiellia bacterium]
MDRNLPMALVTPSFAGDATRCRVLVESVQRYARCPLRHYLLVDERDEALFAPLAGPTTIVVTAESLLPYWLRRPANGANHWMIRGQMPLPNWYTQQILKIAFARCATEPVVVFADSDVAFVRPFDAAPFIRNGAVRLFRVPDFEDEQHRAWHRTALAWLGIPEPAPDQPHPNYVGNLITWKPGLADALCRHLETVAGRAWAEVLAAPHPFSEYMLYGCFIQHVLGGEQPAGHFYDTRPICHDYWLPEPLDEAGLERFFRGLTPDHVAVMVSARAPLHAARYRALVLGHPSERDDPAP